MLTSSSLHSHVGAAVRHAREAADRLLDTVFPPRCIGCETFLRGHPTLACSRCAPTIERVRGPLCPKCGQPRQHLPGTGYHGVDDVCSGCLEFRPPQARARSLWLYEGVIAEAIQAAKYGGDTWRLRALARPLGQWLDDEIDAVTDMAQPDAPARPPLVTVVPMHPDDLRSRGFNAAGLLLRESLRHTRWEARPNLVEKTERTDPQAGLCRGERLRNIRGAFEATTEVDGRTVALFDDVMTTGATASEVAAALTRAGAARVVVLTAARATAR